METKLLTANDNDLKLAADILQNGGTVIFPTETVYGLGANANNPTAVKKIFAAKGRPADNPLIVHISDLSMLDEIVSEIPKNARLLMEKFWPGPLTIIMKKCKSVPYETTARLETVAVRMPKSASARRLIELAKLPIAAPSANLSGKPSPTTAQHCIDDMTGRVDAIICGNDCEVGVESTVLDMSGDKPVLLRPGGVTLEQLREVLGDVETAEKAVVGETPKSPGLKYKHYSPNAEVIILSGSIDEISKYINEQCKTKKVGVLVFDEFPEFPNSVSISLGSNENPHSAAQKLFGALRSMDKLNIEVIFAPQIRDSGMWRAVHNRLYRAAGDNVIDLSCQSANKNTGIKMVLFVCTGNTCRSPIAEGLFNIYAKEKKLNISADSAGIFADGSPVSENSVQVLSELGIDISGKKSKQVTKDMVENSDLILTMTASHKAALISAFGSEEKIHTLAEFADFGGDVPDPYGGNTEEYRVCRDIINELVVKAADKL